MPKLPAWPKIAGIENRISDGTDELSILAILGNFGISGNF
jgi:hypothetical protein